MEIPITKFGQNGNILHRHSILIFFFEFPIQAEKLFYKSNEMTEKLDKPDAKRKIGQCYTNLGLMYWQMGEIDKAIECSEKSIEVWKCKGTYHQKYQSLISIYVQYILSCATSLRAPSFGGMRT